MESENHTEGTNLSPWEPGRFMRTASASEVKLSRGFLRCRPERWFPGFAAQWLPLGHSLGVEIKMIEAKPVLHSPLEQAASFVGSIDGEAIGFSIDPSSARVVTEAIAPGVMRGADEGAGSVVLEYLARRLLTSLAAAWTGPQSSHVRFEPEMKLDEVGAVGDVRISFSVNGTPASVVVSLGRFLVERLDNLWRRQIHSTARAVEAGSVVALEIAQLAVPPSMLGDYLKSGTLIDLEARAGDTMTLRSGTKAWQLVRGCVSNGNYAFEMIAAGGPFPSLPEGTTRLSFSLGATKLDGTVIAELGQSGAMWDTAIPATDRVELLINGESVGEGRLGLYEGRFAVMVA